MQRSSINVVEPVAWIQWKKFDFGPLWKIRGFVQDKAPRSDMCFEGHQQTLAPAPLLSQDDVGKDYAKKHNVD